MQAPAGGGRDEGRGRFAWVEVVFAMDPVLGTSVR